jgi:hypothetical protein
MQLGSVVPSTNAKCLLPETGTLLSELQQFTNGLFRRFLATMNLESKRCPRYFFEKVS